MHRLPSRDRGAASNTVSSAPSQHRGQITKQGHGGADPGVLDRVWGQVDPPPWDLPCDDPHSTPSFSLPQSLCIFPTDSCLLCVCFFLVHCLPDPVRVSAGSGLPSSWSLESIAQKFMG